jgi:ATP/ADP translocase
MAGRRGKAVLHTKVVRVIVLFVLIYMKKLARNSKGKPIVAWLLAFFIGYFYCLGLVFLSNLFPTPRQVDLTFVQAFLQRNLISTLPGGFLGLLAMTVWKSFFKRAGAVSDQP